MDVFLERGFDAATTGEIAAAADLGAGTFYLHFETKRACYETLCRRAAREMIDRWRAGVRRTMPVSDRIALALRVAAEFWEEDRARARLLLEGGPTFGAEAHYRLLEDLAQVMDGDLAGARQRDPSLPSAEVVATVVVGLGIELGRVIVGSPAPVSRRTIDGTIALARRALGTLPARVAAR
jgi:AcrR family transcriptional regulator